MSNYVDKTYIGLLLLGLFLSNFSLHTYAVSPHAVNVVAVPVEDQTERTRRSALNSAFRNVILKMTGSRDVLKSTSLRGITASDYLKAYQYELNSNTLEYVATFDSDKMQQLLRQLSLPIWEARRPDSLLWLSMDTDSSVHNSILAEGVEHAFTQSMQRVSRARGLTIVLPLMDIEDRSMVSDYDVWGRFDDPVIAASERYGIDHVIIARIRKKPVYDPDELQRRIEVINRGSEISEEAMLSSSQSDHPPEPKFTLQEFQQLMDREQPFQLDYTYIIAGQRSSGSLTGNDQLALFDELLESFIDLLSSRYAIKLEQQSFASPDVFRVNNIGSLSAYQGLMSFLDSQTLVDKAILVEQSGTTATVELTLLTDRQRFINAMLLDGPLKPIVNEFGDVIDDSQLDWQP